MIDAWSENWPLLPFWVPVEVPVATGTGCVQAAARSFGPHPRSDWPSRIKGRRQELDRERRAHVEGLADQIEGVKLRVPRNRWVDRGRIRVLGGEPVVHRDDPSVVRRPTCAARPAAWKASSRTYTPPWKYGTTWRGSLPATVISAAGTPPSAAAVTVTSAGSGCADVSSHYRELRLSEGSPTSQVSTPSLRR